ncbi:hypothetical protein F443_13387 [Phytophthora nicotianae P1569]|uniref:BED-type domain-containing protein n=1 Tax=Phytophthora nicotianae P1569 TaxID=1317065 RepID=V9ESD0_PHYNI|nr:hypothetical protein F443_13387 [Phytophthora nicotianae P1569]
MSEASLMPSQRSQSSFTPKQIAEFYFKPYLTEDGDPTGLQVCKACGKTRKHVPRTGYTNLVSHVKAAHPRFELEMKDASIAATGSLLPWVRQKASNRYAWLEWVFSANLPLSFVEMESTRRFPHEADLEQVQSLMKRLRTLTQAAKLRLKTSLKPKLRQKTRWGSTYAMLARYFALREFISADDEDLADVMPSPAANRRLKALLLELADIESVSMKLQSEDLNLLDARDLLDGLLEFESAVIKVLGGRAKLLSRAEKAALKPFERKTAEAADVTEKKAKVGFADRILKRRKVQEDKSAYSQLNAIPPTSNAAERLFSMARMVLRYERNRLSPLMLDMLLFLKLNSKYWDVTTVDAVI